MASVEFDLLGAFEVHSVEQIRANLDTGFDVRAPRIAPVLLDDAEALTSALRDDATLMDHRPSMVSSFTPLIPPLAPGGDRGNHAASR